MGENQTLVFPWWNNTPFALDGGEEPELAGLYVIDPDSKPFRVGFAVGNGFSRP